MAVSWRPDEDSEHDDLVVVSAPVTELEDPLARLADTADPAGVLIVTGDPPDGSDAGRKERLEAAVRLVGEAQDHGLRIAGSFHQPAVDGYEWHRGFDAHLGLFDRDRNPRPALDALPGR